MNKNIYITCFDFSGDNKEEIYRVQNSIIKKKKEKKLKSKTPIHSKCHNNKREYFKKKKWAIPFCKSIPDRDQH